MFFVCFVCLQLRAGSCLSSGCHPKLLGGCNGYLKDTFHSRAPPLTPPPPTTTTTTTTTAGLTPRQDCTVLPAYAGVRCCHPFCCLASAIENNAVMFITLTNLTEMGLCQCQSWNEASVCLGFYLICMYSVFVWVSVLSVCIVSLSGFLSYLCV